MAIPTFTEILALKEEAYLENQKRIERERIAKEERAKLQAEEDKKKMLIQLETYKESVGHVIREGIKNGQGHIKYNLRQVINKYTDGTAKEVEKLLLEHCWKLGYSGTLQLCEQSKSKCVFDSSLDDDYTPIHNMVLTLWGW